jgi:hypothetical protein
MTHATLGGIKHYMRQSLKLGAWLDSPGDGRVAGVIPARDLTWALLAGILLRIGSALGTARTLTNASQRSTGLVRTFAHEALHYFTERLSVEALRGTLYALVRRAKRMKAFDGAAHIGLAIDGTGVGRRTECQCPWCLPVHSSSGEVLGHTHKLVALSVVGVRLPLLIDVEPYGPADSEYRAAQRLLRRAMTMLGRGFADYLVVDGGLATAPFLHEATALRIPIIARLKANLPSLLQQAEQRFHLHPPCDRFQEGKDTFELWDETFPPWETLDWSSVRVLRYRQTKPDGTVIEAMWLSNIAKSTMGSRRLARAAKSRWEIENEGFNVAKNQYHFAVIRHHHENSMLVQWLLTFLAIDIERLYRIRFLHRGTHPVMESIALSNAFWTSLEPRSWRWSLAPG